MKGNFDDGILSICECADHSKPGRMAKEVLTKVSRHWYEERTISFRRQYAAKGANEQIDLLVRIHYDPRARIGKFAILGNGEQFRIDNVTTAYDSETRLRYTELTLSRLEDFYELAEAE